MPDWLSAGMSLAAPAVGMGVEALGHNMQVRHQQDFVNQQVSAANQMGKNNQALALEMWDKTNYAAQRKQMEKAGLNVGLMYGQGGGGGVTSSVPTGSATGGQAPNPIQMGQLGLQMAAQTRLLESQAKNLDADTANKTANTIKTSGADTAKSVAETNAIYAGIDFYFC